MNCGLVLIADLTVQTHTGLKVSFHSDTSHPPPPREQYNLQAQSGRANTYGIVSAITQW